MRKTRKTIIAVLVLILISISSCRPEPETLSTTEPKINISETDLELIGSFKVKGNGGRGVLHIYKFGNDTIYWASTDGSSDMSIQLK